MMKLNGIVCDDFLHGTCDDLSKNPKNYIFTFILTLVFNYGLPVIVGITLVSLYGAPYIIDTIIIYFSSVFPAIATMYLMNTMIGTVVVLIIIAVLDFFYLIYMWKQVGIYIIVPLVMELIKWIVILVVPSLIVIAILISIIPFMSIAVAVHFIERIVNKGIVIKST